MTSMTYSEVLQRFFCCESLPEMSAKKPLEVYRSKRSHGNANVRHLLMDISFIIIEYYTSEQ